MRLSFFFLGGVTATAPSRDLTDNKKKKEERGLKQRRKQKEAAQGDPEPGKGNQEKEKDPSICLCLCLCFDTHRPISALPSVHLLLSIAATSLLFIPSCLCALSASRTSSPAQRVARACMCISIKTRVQRQPTPCSLHPACSCTVEVYNDVCESSKAKHKP